MKVSAIIPNYNYAKVLGRRIGSIIKQSFKPGEIIFLDDCSTDNSLEVAESHLARSNIPYRVITSKTNQGVFVQWLKGIELAESDYCWICEADDYCEPDFLERLLPFFEDDDVVLAYCQSRFVDSDGMEICNYYNYISRYFDFSRWERDYKNNGVLEISNYLCCLNTIPNASAVIVNKRRIDFEKIAQIRTYRHNGDWLFYILCLSSCGENKISYSPAPLNYFVRHQESVFGNKDHSTRPMVEFLTIMRYALENYSIDRSVKEVMLRTLIGNLVYWPVDAKINPLLKRVMSHLPRDDFYMVYNQEAEKIISTLQHKVGQCEKRIREQDLLVSDMQSQLLETNSHRSLAGIQSRIKLLLSACKALYQLQK